jgi:putative ABC transport system substrate-binding protein
LARKVARIGYLGLTTPSSHAKYSQAFRDGLRRLGYVEGTNVVIDFRFAEENTDRLPALAADLVRDNVDVIVTYATGVPVAKRTTATIPIVMATYGDAISTGVVASLAQPGGNVTGSTFFNPELMVKRLELLKEVVPSMTKSGVLLVRGHELNGAILQAMARTADALSVTLQPFEVRGPREFESAFTAWADKDVGAVVIQDHAFLNSNTKPIAALAAKQRLPSAGPLELPANGGH